MKLSSFAVVSARFSEDDDDEEVVRDLFTRIDKDNSHSVSKEELSDALADLQGDGELGVALKDLLSKSEALAEEIPFDAFQKAFRELPRVRGERVRWAASLRLEQVLARHLVKGHVFDGLKGLKDLTEKAAEDHIQDVCAKFLAELPGVLREALANLRAGHTAGSAAEQHMNSKFVMQGAYVGSFASLNDFYKGPEALIGVPNPKIYEGAEKEHTLRKNAWMTFATSNYGLETCPAIEWQFVVDPFGAADPKSEHLFGNAKYPHTPREKEHWRQEEARAWLEGLLKQVPGASRGPTAHTAEGWKGVCGREPVPIDDFLAASEVRREVERGGLRREECICLRLYTGPMFVLYNASLRGFPRADVDSLAGNKFETTIFTIASGVTKLSKITGIPADRRLFRGLGGMVLPEHFWRAFAECVVTFHVKADDLDRVKAALDAGVEERDAFKGKDGTLKTKMIRLAGWAAHVPPTAPGHGDDLVRVVAEHRVVGDSVRMTVALPFSKFDFTEQMQLLFREAVLATSGAGGSVEKVVVDEVADKPKDFKGGGATLPPPSQPNPHPPPPP